MEKIPYEMLIDGYTGLKYCDWFIIGAMSGRYAKQYPFPEDMTTSFRECYDMPLFMKDSLIFFCR